MNTVSCQFTLEHQAVIYTVTRCIHSISGSYANVNDVETYFSKYSPGVMRFAYVYWR